MGDIIQVKHLFKLYRVGDDVVRALNGVDFSIQEGEFCAIVGKSGSGKSTLLNMLAGLEKPTRGEIVIAGKHIEGLSENELVKFRREHVGFIFQSFHLIGSMNALENVALPLSFRGVPKEQQQRVGVARALVLDPKIIFADEPTGNLDSNTSRQVMELMKSVVKNQNKTLVMVTHDNELASYADRVFHILDGEIVKIENNKREEQ